MIIDQYVTTEDWRQSSGRRAGHIDDVADQFERRPDAIDRAVGGSPAEASATS